MVSLSIGLLLGTSADRAISIGYYLVGSFLLIGGFFIGNRGPARPKGNVGPPVIGPRYMRWATLDEQEDALNLSAVFVVLGLVLLLLGIVVDSRVSLF